MLRVKDQLDLSNYEKLRYALNCQYLIRVTMKGNKRNRLIGVSSLRNIIISGGRGKKEKQEKENLFFRVCNAALESTTQNHTVKLRSVGKIEFHAK